MKIKTLSLLCVLMASLSANAEVTEQSENHFIVKHQLTSNKSLEHVYQQFSAVSQWWESDHTFSGKAENLYFDFAKERCFCERMPDNGFVRHLEVIHVQPRKRVVFSGGLGPLQDQTVNGKMIWSFEQTDKGVKVDIEYRVYGKIVDGMGKWPGAVDFVLGTQVKRLKALL